MGQRTQDLDVDKRTQVPTEEYKTAPLLAKKDLKKGITERTEDNGQVNCNTVKNRKTQVKPLLPKIEVWKIIRRSITIAIYRVRRWLAR